MIRRGYAESKKDKQKGRDHWIMWVSPLQLIQCCLAGG